MYVVLIICGLDSIRLPNPVSSPSVGADLVSSLVSDYNSGGNDDAALQCTPSLDNLELAPNDVVKCHAVYEVRPGRQLLTRAECAVLCKTISVW